MPNASPPKIAKLWVILKPLAMAAKASNAPLATNGLAYPLKNLFVRKKVLLWLAMKPDKPVVAILATDYINNVLAIRATNTLARVRATREVLVPPAAANTPLAPAPLATNGKMVVARNKHRMEQLASCIIAMAAVGELYYCNGKVVGVRATGMGFYVALRDLGQMTWSNANNQCRNYSFCGNVKGTLPTKDQLLTLYNNKSRVNSLLSTNGGTQLTNSGTQLTNSYYWSSTRDGYDYYYLVDMYYGGVGHGYGSSYVRPVLASW